MTCQPEDNPVEYAVEHLIEYGFDGVAEAIGLLLNTAMQIERSRYLGADPYERSDNRKCYANGFKPKTVKTRMGKIPLQIPQTRDSNFYPKSLQRGLRSERALKLALAEMYIQGVSTRKVTKITEELCGLEVSSSEVSRATKELDEQLTAWRNRPLGAYPYIYLDARYENVRHGGSVVGSAVLIAIGVSTEGKREVLGCSVALSEQDVHWRQFFSSLKDRGLHGVTLFISDAHEGLKSARKAIFPSVPWQRCQFHLQQNAGGYVPKQNMKKEVAARLRSIFTAPNKVEAERLLVNFQNDYRDTAPGLVIWSETAVPEGLTIFNVSTIPTEHHKRLRTTNMLERLNKEIKRRTRVALIFPNEASCLRLVTAVAMETSEEWVTGKTYLQMQEQK